MQRILVVDDEEINRLVLEAGLSDIFEVIQAKNGQEALDYLCFGETIDAVLLDLNMPGLSGFDVLIEMNETALITRIPVFILTSTSDEQALIRTYELGAVDVISKPYNLQFLRRRLLNTIELFTQRNSLSKIVAEKTRELVRQNNRLVEAMADIVEFRSNESGAHVKRVSTYTKVLMERLVQDYPEYKNLNDDIESITFAATLHDLGKIAIPDSILNKPGKYTQEEFDVMKTHTIHGYEQVLTLRDIMDPKLYEYSLDIVRHHHERYDGNGYPDKLKGDELSIWSQAVSLADVYDALTTSRCYKKAFSHEQSCEMILNGECGVFNPKIIEVFKTLKDKFDELRLGITRKKILIVDDSEVDRASLRTILISKYDVVETESGIEALTRIDSNAIDFDAAIIDVHMPNIDGFNLLKRLGKDFVHSVPVVMCSSEVDKDNIKQASEYGARGFLKKPFDVDFVLRKMESVINEI